MDQAEIAPIRQLLAAGRVADATKAIDAALETSPGEPLLLAYRAVMHMEAGDIDRAESELTELTSRVSEPMDAATQAFAELWLGYLSNRRKKPERAVKHFEASAALEAPSADLCAALCQTYTGIGKMEKARDWGARALDIRASEGECPDDEKVSTTRPHSFDPAARQRNVIAFSLFGDDPYYRECAVTIARTARGFFPEFTCWFYCARDVPDQVKASLHRNGGKVIVAAPEAGQAQHPFMGLLWRFLPFDEKEVDVVLVRDIDSPFTLRERFAIDRWLATDAPFLTMRDHIQHTEPLMAGMWGGFTGLLPPLIPILNRYRPPGNSKFIDQIFLRRLIWPRIRDAVLSIDSNYTCGRTLGFPEEADRPGSWGVGTGWRRSAVLGGAGPER